MREELAEVSSLIKKSLFVMSYIRKLGTQNNNVVHGARDLN